MPASNLDLHSLTQAVKEEARRLGFAWAGVTTPDPPPHFPVFRAWIEDGRQGEMNYLAAERALQRRADPRAILPECRSILVLGLRYPVPDKEGGEKPSPGPAQGERGQDAPGLSQGRGREEGSSGPYGRVAAYAWGGDYHDVLPPRLRALVSFIETQVGSPVPNRWYTDTGPVLERDLAQRAGLGWIGKNTCLIDPRQGSYFLLAEILLGIDLAPDPPFLSDLCGKCTRCLEACPTACILPDRTIDARRCISYLTIELKGPVPAELRPQMGEWVFGCDVCQEVCPWNIRFAAPSGDPALAPRPEIPRPDLIEELALTQEAFNRKFGKQSGAYSPVKRARRRGYLRNVAVALGNSGRLEAAPALARALQEDPEPLVRGHAAWALGRLGGEPARQALAGAARHELHPAVQAEISAALAQFRLAEPPEGD